MSHVTYEWVVSHINESCHVWMSRVPYKWVMSRIMHHDTSCHVWMHLVALMCHGTYEWGTSLMNTSWHMWMRHVTREFVITFTNESHHGSIGRWHMNESWRILQICPALRTYESPKINLFENWELIRRQKEQELAQQRTRKCVAVCCSVLQCVAVCCSVLQCVAVCCSVLQWVAVCCSVLQ